MSQIAGMVLAAIYVAFLIVILLYYRADSRKIMKLAERAHLMSVPTTTEPTPA